MSWVPANIADNKWWISRQAKTNSQWHKKQRVADPQSPGTLFIRCTMIFVSHNTTHATWLHLRRACRERFPRHRPLVSDPSMHHGTCHFKPIPWLLMACLLVSPRYQPLWYGLSKIARSLSSMQTDFKCPHDFRLARWYKMQICFCVF